MKLKGRLICFVGIDGSGKSTLAGMLYDELTSKGYSVDVKWLRMNYFFTKPVLLFCRITGLTRRPSVGTKKISVHEFYRCPPIAWAVRWLHSLDTFLHYIFKIYLPLLFTKKVIICDRFLHDVFVDFAIEGRRERVFDTILFKVCKNLMLSKAICLLILTPEKDILKRRPDVLLYDKDFARRFRVFNELSKSGDLQIIHNTEDLNFAFQQVLASIQK
jgi:hypothetical protein